MSHDLQRNIKDDFGRAKETRFLRSSVASYATMLTWQNYSFCVSEDIKFLLRGGNYRLIAPEIFMGALTHLGQNGAVHIHPTDFKELRERDMYSDSYAKSNQNYILYLNVLTRIYEDTILDGDQRLHGMIMLGKEKDIIRLAEDLRLPHPFEDNEHTLLNILRKQKDGNIP